MQISNVILLRKQFPWHSSDSAPPAGNVVDSFQVFKITLMDQNTFLSAKLGLKSPNNINEMVP